MSNETATNPQDANALPNGNTFDPKEVDTQPETEDEIEEEVQEGEDADETDDADADEGEGDEGDGEPSAEDDTEEVEYEGKKFRAPKGVKSAMLMQADYTRKTQEVAEQRRVLQERDQELSKHTEVQRDNLVRVAGVVAMNNRLAQFEQLDFNAIRAQDPDRANSLQFEYLQLKGQRDNALTELQTEVNKQQSETAARRAKQIEEGRAILQRDIQGWSPEVAGKLTQYAVAELGFSAEEVGQVLDPRLIKWLHRTHSQSDTIAKQSKEIAALKKALAGKQVKPAAQVSQTNAGANPRRTTDSTGDKLSMTEWVKREQERVNKRKKG